MSFIRKYLEKHPHDYIETALSFYAALDAISAHSPNIAKSILQELKDQRSHLKMIASENYTSLTTQLAMGNLFTDKYSEGFAKHRFYAGCENVDDVEEEAKKLAETLFGAEHAYVQPHSGADANLIAFWAILMKRIQDPFLAELGKKTTVQLTEEEHEKLRQLLINQKVFGMSLNSGGHLTHGYRMNISSKIMKAYSYDVDPLSHLLDYDDIEKQVREIAPLIIIVGYSAYSRNIDFSIFRRIADSVGATLMVDMAHFAGLVAGKVFEGRYNPVAYADIVTSTTHKTLRGPRGGLILCSSEYKEWVDKGCPLVIGGPLPHVMAAKAVAFREALRPEFSQYAHAIVSNAKALAEGLTQKGVRIVTGGTDNHLIVCDVHHSFGINGRQAESALRSIGITCNRNTVPFDPLGPWYTSGIRLGTPALTTRGLGAGDMKRVAEIIYTALSHVKSVGEGKSAEYHFDERVQQELRAQVIDLLKKYPLYPELDLE